MTRNSELADRKEISAGDAKAALTDAIANLLHVIAHETPTATDEEVEVELGGLLAQAIRTGTGHYVTERDDDLTLVVITD